MSAEQRGFFENRRGRRLFFAAHGARTAGRVWLFCNPLLEEKTFSHGVYVHLARTLAARGEFVLRFDYEGDGDSDGEYDALGMSDFATDVVDACAWVQSSFGLTVSALFGLRFGAAVAARAADAGECRQLLLWEPVESGAQYLDDCLKLNLTTQLSTFKRVVEGRPKMRERLARGDTIDVGGYRIGPRMANELQSFELAQSLARLPAATRIDIVKLTRRETAPAPSRAHVSLCQATPFWQEPRYYDPAQPAFVAASAEAWDAARGGSLA